MSPLCTRRVGGIAWSVIAVALAVRPALAAFPGSNGRIVFTREDNEVHTIGVDGTGETNVSNHPGSDDDPSWSPDGTRLAFQSNRGGSSTLWVMDADGGNPMPIPGSVDGDDEPTWSPDGTRIAFKRGGGGDDEIWVVNLDGSGLANLTNFPQDDDVHPSWSPDGTRIAFDRDGDIWAMNADGSGQTNLGDVLPTDRENDEHPKWSPDGSRIVFDAELGGNREIFVMDADGTNVVQLTSNGADDSHAAWSPDGTLIAFQSDRAPNHEDKVWVMDADGQNPRVVGDAAASDDDREPDWQPLALPTTTLATTTTSVTTTTLPSGTPAPGRKLVLKDRAGKPAKRALVLLAKDRSIGVGAENGGGGDPVLHGGFLKVVSATGDGFNHTYDLPADRWRYKGKAGRNKGYRLAGAGPIRSVAVKIGKTVKVVAKGDALGHSLGADPAPVHVALGLGAERYCFTFGGRTKFKAGRSYVATKAPAPGACAALMPACGDGLLEAGEICPLLEGRADAMAIDAVHDFDAGEGVPDGEITVDEAGLGVARTRLEIAFALDATVGAVNAAIARVGGRIVSMLDGVLILVVEIPDPGDLTGLEAAIATVASQPAVRHARRVGFPAALDVPDNYGSMPDFPKLDHHLAVRAHAAWNVRGLLPRTRTAHPLVVVGDFFGAGPPGTLFDVADIDADYGGGRPNEHGYHVLGIITAAFGGPTSGPGLATGIFPATTALRVADMIVNGPHGPALRTGPELANLLLQRIRHSSGNVVLNTSLGFVCSNALLAPLLCNTIRAEQEALTWIEKVRGSTALTQAGAGLESRFFHATAAGNVDVPGDTDARVASEWTAASLLPDLDTLTLGGFATVPNLTNTVAVENLAHSGEPPFPPACLAAISKRPHTPARPANLGAIGISVFSLTGPAGPADSFHGTSMASPQVAGLAAYLWALAPTLSPQALAALLRDTAGLPLVDLSARPICAPGEPSAPVLDAYAAVLSLDEATLPTPAAAPIRHALLDLDQDGDFDGDDLEYFLVAYIHSYTDAANHGPPQEPADHTFGRFDLNGDGFEGGRNRLPFDLDRVGSSRYGAARHGIVTQDIEGSAAVFDETGLTDLEVLCYYVYSALWSDTEAERRRMVDPAWCNPVTMAVAFPAAITPGAPETLRVTTTRKDPAGGSQPAANVHIELTPSGGTTVPQTGTTNAQGEFTAHATLGLNSGGIQILVRARTGPGGAVLAEETVGATSTVPPTRCQLFLDVGANPRIEAISGMLSDESVEGPVRVAGSVEFGRAHLEADYDIANLPWTFDGGGGAIWRDVIVIDTGNPAIDSGTFRHVTRVTHTSSVNNRSRPAQSQGWFDIDSIGFNPGGTLGFVSRNFGGDIPPTVVEYEYDRSFSANEAELDVRTRLSTFTGFGGQEIDAVVSGEITVEWLGVTAVFDHQGNPVPFNFHSTCGGSPPPTTTTTTVLPTTTTTAMAPTTTTTSSTINSTTSTSTSTTTSTTTTTLVGGDPVIPYALYDATGPDAPMVSLTDEFGTEMVDLGAVTLDLPPVAIDGVLPLDPTTHQTCYAHPGAVVDTCVDVQHALGLAPIRVGTPEHVCVPEFLPSIPVDAFKCHAASGAPLGVEVQLADEFQTQTVTVGAPALFCTPVSVDGRLLVSAVRYLVCYRTAPVGAAGVPIQVENALHASTIQVDVGAATGLCLPAVRQLVATCQLCGDGNLDGGEDCDDANLTDGDGCSAVCRFERDCTCDGVPVPPPNGERCAVVADCTATCAACTTGGGACGCN